MDRTTKRPDGTRSHEIHGASTETSTRHSRPHDPIHRRGDLDERIELDRADLVEISQRGVTRRERHAHGFQVAHLERGDHVDDALVLGDDVFCPTGDDRIKAIPLGGEQIGVTSRNDSPVDPRHEARPPQRHIARAGGCTATHRAASVIRCAPRPDGGRGAGWSAARPATDSPAGGPSLRHHMATRTDPSSPYARRRTRSRRAGRSGQGATDPRSPRQARPGPPTRLPTRERPRMRGRRPPAGPIR